MRTAGGGRGPGAQVSQSHDASVLGPGDRVKVLVKGCAKTPQWITASQ